MYYIVVSCFKISLYFRVPDDLSLLFKVRYVHTIPYSVPDSVIDRKVFWWYTLHSVWTEAYVQFPNVPHIQKEVGLDPA